jgi:hypothetical protein
MPVPHMAKITSIVVLVAFCTAELRGLGTKRTEAVRDIMLYGYEGLTRDMFDLETAFNHYLDIWARIKTSSSSSLLLTSKDTTRLGRWKHLWKQQRF